MNDRIEVQGRTVDEAVSEALLQLGARQDEVEVTVLEEPKSGFLGILGARQARVLVKKKRSRSRRGRSFDQDDDHTPYDLGGDKSGDAGSGSRRGGRSRGRRGGRSRSQSAKGDRNGQDAQSRQNRQNGQGAQGGRNGRPAAAKRQEAASPSDGPDRQQEGRRKDKKRPDESKPSRRRRGGRGRGDSSRRRDAAADKGRSLQPADSGQVSAKPDDRKTRRPEDVKEKAAVVEAPTNEKTNGDARRETADRQDARRDDRGGRSRSRRPRRGGRRSNKPASDRPEQRAAAEVEANRMPDEIVVSGIKGVSYSQPIRGIAEEAINETLEAITSGTLARAGFPCRCEIKDGEYRQVRIVTDDSSAGMLIGRHGATVDAVEHIIERMAGMAFGDRVRLNLDINNYRRRREDTLKERVFDAVSKVRESGREFHLEPMCARERRIIHLQAETFDGLRTYTLAGAGGKHVVIALADSEDRNEDQAEDQDVRDVAAPEMTDGVDEAPMAVAAGESTPELASESASEVISEPISEPTPEPEPMPEAEAAPAEAVDGSEEATEDIPEEAREDDPDDDPSTDRTGV